MEASAVIELPVFNIWDAPFVDDPQKVSEMPTRKRYFTHEELTGYSITPFHEKHDNNKYVSGLSVMRKTKTDFVNVKMEPDKLSAYLEKNGVIKICRPD